MNNAVVCRQQTWHSALSSVELSARLAGRRKSRSSPVSEPHISPSPSSGCRDSVESDAPPDLGDTASVAAEQPSTAIVRVAAALVNLNVSISASIDQAKADIVEAVNSLQEGTADIAGSREKLVVSGHFVDILNGSPTNGAIAAKDQDGCTKGGSASWPQDEDDAHGAEILPIGWPRTLELRWEADAPGMHKDSARLSSHHSIDLATFRKASTEKSSEGDGSRRRQKCVIHPNCRAKMIYDTMSALLLVSDMIIIPWMLAWDIALEGPMLYVAWVTAAYWTADIPVSFLTAFHKHGELNFNRHAITHNYLRSWFAPDLLVVLCDWVSLIATSSPGLRVLRFAKLGRLLRLMGVFRMVKLARIMEDLVEANFSDYGKLMLRFVKMFFLTIVYVHAICCTWFLIGRMAPSDTGARWTDSENQVGDVHVIFLDQDMMYQYMTSFHWAMSQITLGSMEMTCSTSIERAFGIICLLLGLIFGSTLVSTLSATMLEVQMDKRENHLKMQQIRRYLSENHVKREIAVQVEKQLSDRLATKQKIHEKQVEGLNMLSLSLRSQLQFHIIGTYLKSHALFRLWIDLDMGLVESLTMNCMEMKTLRIEDDLFRAGAVADGLFFFTEGSLTYTQVPESSPMREITVQAVPPNSWMAEAALCSHWTHVGTARATHSSEAIQLSIEKMGDIMQKTTTVIWITQEYCRNYHRRLQGARPPASAWPDDLQVPSTDWGDLVLSMDKEVQVVIGMSALRTATRGKVKKWARGLDALSQEVRAGKSTVMLNTEGDIERIASIVAMRIHNEAGQMLIQLFKRESGRMAPSCQLPGGKLDRGEVVADTMERLLEGKLAPIANQVDVTKTEREEQWKESKEFGIWTKYLRNIIHLRLEDEACLDACKIPSLSEGDAYIRSRSKGSSNSANSSQKGRGLPMFHTRTDVSVVQRDVERWMFLTKRDVFFIEGSKGAGALYAWLNDQEFDLLKGAVGEEVLPAWLSGLEARAEEKGDATIF